MYYKLFHTDLLGYFNILTFITILTIELFIITGIFFDYIRIFFIFTSITIFLGLKDFLDIHICEKTFKLLSSSCLLDLHCSHIAILFLLSLTHILFLLSLTRRSKIIRISAWIRWWTCSTDFFDCPKKDQVYLLKHIA